MLVEARTPSSENSAECPAPSELAPRQKLSVFVVSYNRAPTLRTCLMALGFADEVIVVDKSSTDDSAAVAAGLADRVISVPWSPTVEETREFALSQCSHPWVLCLDDDECLSLEAIEFIDAELRAPRADIYFLPLRHYILGRHDERAYYWPETHPRLFRRGCVSFIPTVHAGIVRHSERSFEAPAERGVCIHHLSYNDAAEWVAKTNRYTSRPDRARPSEDERDLAAYAHQRIDFWTTRTRGEGGDDYPAAVGLLRAVYDMVDRVKVWEETAGPGGDLLFPRIRRRLEASYTGRLAPPRRLHRARFLESAVLRPEGAAEEEVARLHRTIEALRSALARAEAEREASGRQWEEQREAAARQWAERRETEHREWERQREGERAVAAEQLERTRAELAVLRASTLWRLTAPLRALGSRYPRLVRLARVALCLAGQVRRGLRRQLVAPVSALEPRLAQLPPPSVAMMGPVGTSVFGESEPKPGVPKPLAPEAAAPPCAALTLIETVEPEEIVFPEQRAGIVVSVIVPAFGQVGYTLRCLASMARNLPEAPIEVIVVDDASPDPETERLSRVSGIRLVVNQANLGFLRSCNAAARLARGEFVFFLNNDTQVLPGWLDPMVGLMRARADAGAVGCKLLFPDGRLQEAGAIVWDNATGLTYGRGDDPEQPAYNYVREVDYASGAALLVRSALFARLGGFDERFAPAYCEDSDLGFRIRQAGFKVLYQPRSRVVHFEGVTNGTDLTQGIRRFNEVNQPKLRAKWSDQLATEHYPPDVHVTRACERGRNRRMVLVLSERAAPADLLRLLLAGGLMVKFASLDEVIDRAALEQLGVEVLSAGAAGVRAWLAKHKSELDAAILTDPIAAEALIPTLRLESRARLIYQSAWNGRGAPEWRERSIWRSVEAVLHGSEGAAREAEWLEPAADAGVLGSAPETIAASLGLDLVDPPADEGHVAGIEAALAA
ncbi:MAG: glycosyltransferase [Alphaproteobacteria bacterium]|nr:glycosyltransferase [Alphaproteobacteria bacterium]